MCMPYSHIKTWCFKVRISLLRVMKETHFKITFVLRSFGSIHIGLSMDAKSLSLSLYTLSHTHTHT